MKASFACVVLTLAVLLVPQTSLAGNPDPNNEFLKEYGRYRLYTGNKPTTRSINEATREYRKWLGNGWRDYAASLRHRSQVRRAERNAEQNVTAPMTTRERKRLYRKYRTRSLRRS